MEGKAADRQQTPKRKQISETKQTSETRQRSAKKRSWKKDALNFLLRILIIVVVLYLVITYAIFPYRMSANSMSPFFRDGDLGMFSKLEPYATGDIVMYRTDDGARHIGRIIAAAGQTISFPEETNGLFLVDGYQPAEEVLYETREAEDSKVSFPLTVPQDSWFILNDFRTDTHDSREYGCISSGSLEGKLIYLFRRRNF